jgi:endonuclease/exonuclease/phosphatase family metal-dependent hydrolase
VLGLTLIVDRFASRQGPRRALVCAAALLTLLLAPASASAMRAMTWNIAGGPSNDATGPRAQAGVSFDLNRVRTVIATYAPDVLALQESCTWEANSIAASLGYNVSSEPAVRGLEDPRPGAGGTCDFGNAVLTKSSLPVSGEFRTDLLNPSECKGGGLLLGIAECRTDMGVLASIGGAPIRATSAHVGSSTENYQGEGNQTTQIATIVDDAKRQESSALMMGDYNFPPQYLRLAPKMQDLGYTDAGGSTPGEACDPADNCFLTSPSGGAFGAPFLKGDYIYYRGYTPIAGGYRGTGTATVRGVQASDHLPLIADLQPNLPIVTLNSPAERSATAELSPVLKGFVAGAPGATVTVSLYSGATATGTPLQTSTVTPGADGGWSVPVNSVLLGEGTYTARAQISADVYSSTNTFVVDRSAPTTQITDPQAMTDAKPTFSLASSEPDSWPYESGPHYECALDEGAWQTCDNPARFSGVPDGPHTFRARSIDAAGNVDLLGASTSFTVDATIPTTAITTPAPGLLATGAFIAFQSSEAASHFHCQFDSGPITTCSSPKVIPNLKPGPHAFNVRASDSVGNIDPRGATIRWQTAPVLKTLTFSPTAFIPVAPKRKGGGTVASYSFSGRARLQLLFEQAGTGLLGSAQQCLYASRSQVSEAKNSGAPETCVRWVRRGTTTTAYGDTTAKKIKLTGRLLGVVLPAGRYRVTATPVDSANRKGRPRTRLFTVKPVPKPKPKPKPKKKKSRG